MATVTEIADDVYRINVVLPGRRVTFSLFLINDDLPTLVETSFGRVFDEVKNTPLLILDDLGDEVGSPWAREKLYQIIVHRHNARMPTVITSKLDFTKEVGAIASRIQDVSIGDIIRIDSPDFRRKTAGRSSNRGRGSGR